MPAADWEEVVHRLDDVPPDDTPFTPDDVGWGADGWYLGPWLPEEEVEWFSDDLIDKYGGEVDWGNPNYDNLFLPGEAADEIANELRTRGHHVEKTLTDDLSYWLSSACDDRLGVPNEEATASSPTRRLIFMISTEGKSKDQVKAEARQAYLKYLLESEKARDQES
jgi:hypothetical protein